MVIFAVKVFLFSHMSEDIAVVSRNLNIFENNLNSLPVKEEHLLNLRADYALAKDNVELLKNSFPVKDEVIDVIREIEKISSRTGNKEEIKIAVSQAKKDESLNAVSLQVVLYGDFKSLMDFLAELENGKYQAAVIGLRTVKISENNSVYSQDQIVNTEAADIKSVLDIQVYVL